MLVFSTEDREIETRVSSETGIRADSALADCTYENLFRLVRATMKRRTYEWGTVYCRRRRENRELFIMPMRSL